MGWDGRVRGMVPGIVPSMVQWDGREQVRGMVPGNRWLAYTFAGCVLTAI